MERKWGCGALLPRRCHCWVYEHACQDGYSKKYDSYDSQDTPHHPPDTAHDSPTCDGSTDHCTAHHHSSTVDSSSDHYDYGGSDHYDDSSCCS